MKIACGFLFLLLSFALPGVLHAHEEQRTIDSLNAIINNPAAHDTARIGARCEIGEVIGYMRVGYWDTIAADCEKLLLNVTDTLVRNSLLSNQAQCYNNICFICKRSGET